MVLHYPRWGLWSPTKSGPCLFLKIETTYSQWGLSISFWPEHSSPIRKCWFCLPLSSHATIKKYSWPSHLTIPLSLTLSHITTSIFFIPLTYSLIICNYLFIWKLPIFSNENVSSSRTEISCLILICTSMWNSAWHINTVMFSNCLINLQS